MQKPHIFQIYDTVHFLHLELIGLRNVNVVDRVSLHNIVQTLAFEKTVLITKHLRIAEFAGSRIHQTLSPVSTRFFCLILSHLARRG